MQLKLSIPRGYGDQYRQTLRLAGPVVLSQLGQVLVQITDNVMVGRLGAIPLAAVSFTGAVAFLFFIFGMGISFGLTPLVGEAFSQRKHRISAIYFQNALLLYAVIGVLLSVLVLLTAPLLHHMGQTPEVVEAGMGFYKYIGLSIIPFMVFAAFKQFLEGVGNTRVAMVIVLGSNVINILFNYLLIYGKWGFPEMGVAGSGMATLIARICMAVSIIFYFYSKDSLKRYFAFFADSNFGANHIRALFKVGWPISIQMVIEFIAFGITSVMMGWIGAVELAANQVTIAMVNSTFMVVVGISSATTIRISHAFGRGDLKELRRAANASYHITFVWNVISALLFLAFREIFPLLFTSDPMVVDVAAQLLLFAAVFQISDGFQIISLGVLRGMQDVKSTMWIAFISYVVINIPIGYLLAFELGMGPGGLWASFIFGLSIAGFLLNRRYRKLYARLGAESR